MIRLLIIATVFSLLVLLFSCKGTAIVNPDENGLNEIPSISTCDTDGDGYIDMNDLSCAGGNDCDDENPFIHPGAQEYCDDVDQDCNGDPDNNCINGLCNATGVIFCDDFETGNFDRWNDLHAGVGGNVPPEERIIEEQGPHSVPGNHVARLWLAPGSGGAELRHYFNGPGEGQDKLYLRWYQKWESAEDNSHPEWNPNSGYGDDYDFSAANHGSGLYAIDESQAFSDSGFRPTGYDKFTGSIEPVSGTNEDLVGRLNIYTYYPAMYMDCADPNGSCWGDHFPCMFSSGRCSNEDHNPPPLPPHMEVGRWYCLQIMLDGGTTGETGAENFWIDGVEYGPWENLWMRSSEELKIRMLHLTLYHHNQHSNAGIRYDDVISSTEPIPCGPIGPVN